MLIIFRAVPKSAWLIIAVSVALMPPALADVTVTSGIQSSVVHIDIERETEGGGSTQSLQFEPNIGLQFSGKRSDFTANFRHRYIEEYEQDISNETDDITRNDKNNLSSFSLAGNLSLIDNVLSVNASHNQNYQNIDTFNTFAVDENVGNSQLSKTTNSSAEIALTLEEMKYVGFSIVGRESRVKTDRGFDSAIGLDSTNRDIRTSLFSQDSASRLSFRLNASLQNTEGNGLNDIESKRLGGSVYVALTKHLRLVATGDDETNEFSSEEDSDPVTREFESTGFGLSYYLSSEKFFDVTYNTSTTDEDDEKDKYIGVDFDWRLSSRTSVAGSYGRRFFGETGSFALNYNLRKVRVRVLYEEEVSNFTRLITSPQSSGVVVCPVASLDITQCFQPDSLNYQLQAGEEFRTFTGFQSDLLDDTTIRKSIQTAFSYRFRKVMANLSLQASESEFVDSNRLQTSESGVFGLRWNMSKKSIVGVSVRVNRVERDGIEPDSTTKGDTTSVTLSYDRKLSKNLTATLELQSTDSNADETLNTFNTSRASARISYKFK